MRLGHRVGGAPGGLLRWASRARRRPAPAAMRAWAARGTWRQVAHDMRQQQARADAMRDGVARADALAQRVAQPTGGRPGQGEREPRAELTFGARGQVGRIGAASPAGSPADAAARRAPACPGTDGCPALGASRPRGRRRGCRSRATTRAGCAATARRRRTRPAGISASPRRPTFSCSRLGGEAGQARKLGRRQGCRNRQVGQQVVRARA